MYHAFYEGAGRNIWVSAKCVFVNGTWGKPCHFIEFSIDEVNYILQFLHSQLHLNYNV